MFPFIIVFIQFPIIEIFCLLRESYNDNVLLFINSFIIVEQTIYFYFF